MYVASYVRKRHIEHNYFPHANAFDSYFGIHYWGTMYVTWFVFSTVSLIIKLMIIHMWYNICSTWFLDTY